MTGYFGLVYGQAGLQGQTYSTAYGRALHVMLAERFRILMEQEDIYCEV